MQKDREVIRAALGHSFGQWSRRLQRIAHLALRSSQVGLWADPRLIAIGLGFETRPVTRADRIVTVNGGRIDYLWEDDPRETSLNVFLGLSMLLLWRNRLDVVPTDVYRVAGYLALPETSLPHEVVVDVQRHAPLWFLEARRRDGSGTYLAVGLRGAS